MSAPDDPRRLTDDLRRALDSRPAPQLDPDALLTRVRARRDRRRARRRGGLALVGAGCVATAAVLVVLDARSGPEQVVADPSIGATTGDAPPLESDPVTPEAPERSTPSPDPTPPPTGGDDRPGPPDRPRVSPDPDPPARPDRVVDLSVDSVISSGAGFSVVGTGSCAGATCRVVAELDDDGLGEVRRAPRVGGAAPLVHTGSRSGVATTPAGVDRWAWGGRLHASHDAGETWDRVALVGQVTEVQASARRAWAVGTGVFGSGAVWSSPVDTDAWAPAPAPIRFGEQVRATLVDDRVAAFALGQGGARDESLSDALVVSTDDGATWTRRSLPCNRVLDGAAGAGRIWVACRYDRTLWVLSSRDDGTTWKGTEIGRDAPIDFLEPVDAGRALLGAEAYLVEVDARGGIDALDLPFDPVDDVWGDGARTYRSAVIRPDGVGYAVTSGGAVAGTTDGGRSWRRLDLDPR